MTAFRIAAGGRIDRGRPLSFTFDGRRYTGYGGDTLASALLANDVAIVGRSFKLHRPRGLLAAGLEEPNALVTIGRGSTRTVNLRATEIPLIEGLEARSQNAWPSLRFDLGRLNDLVARVLPAGFYHKTFMWPAWRWYEPLVRRAAGLGRLGTEPDADRYAKRAAHCEVLVIGAGPAGLAAALAASADPGRDVMLVESDVAPGGTLLRAPPGAFLDDALRKLASRANVRVLPRTTALGFYDDGFVSAVEQVDGAVRERLWKIRAGRVILATGAYERPLAFAGNDLPGVMLADAIDEYACRYAVAAGCRVVLFGNNDAAAETALRLQALGIPVVAVVDLRAQVDAALAAQLRAAGIPLHAGCALIRARGFSRLRGIELARLDARGGFVAGSRQRLDCDAVGMAGGWNPVLHLYSQAGGKLAWDQDCACFRPGAIAQAVRCAGAANGRAALEDCVADGEAAGRDTTTPEAAPTAVQAYWRAPAYAGRDRTHRQWVDYLHDVTVADIDLAAREGFVSVEHLKRYTATGMAVDQGKTSNVSALAILGEATGRAPPAVGTTTFRPPFHPVTIGALAGSRVGALAQRYRRLPVTQHEALGGVLEDHGGWLRPAYYLRAGESANQAIVREVRAARSASALFDSSSLGKLEVFGPDAATFLNRIYVNNVRTLQPGRLRYGLMLTESGVIRDDGVCACLAPGHFLVCTSSAGALDIAFWMEEWLQCEWPELAVQLVPQTAQWATLTVSGPHARTIVVGLDSGIDLSPAAFPHMHCREGGLDAQPLRIRRASFTGELSFEIDVAADGADALWERLLALGAPHGLTPLGMEALDVLRIEKGFLEVGVDTDGETTPLDCGWAEAIAKKPDDFIGRRSLSLREPQRAGRLQLCGLLTDDPQRPVPVGTHAFTPDGALLGHVTSSCSSPTLGRTLAMARLRGGADRLGETALLDIAGTRHLARVAERAFYDPKGARLDG